MIALHAIERHFQVGEQWVQALRGLELQIANGEYIAIMGPSGSGKSTLLNVLGLLDRPDAGEYQLDGVAVAGLADQDLARLRRERIGFVFQAFHLIPRLTAAENVELPLLLAGIAARERQQRVQQALESLGLGNRADHRPEQLSGGQRQRVAIARAIILRPGLLLADEPTGNLDQHSGAEVLNILEGLNQHGITLVMVTHDPDIGLRAGRCVRLRDGQIVEDTRRVSA